MVREDPERQGLLYAGTEFGVFVSFDNGSHWQPLQLNFPVTPVTDMKIHRGDLVLSTQGRAFWILDDVAPLRQLADQLVSHGNHLLRPQDTYRVRYSSGFGDGESNRASSADPQYPPPGAMIDYWIQPNSSSPITIDIIDGRGSIVRSYSTEPQPDSGAALPSDVASIRLNSAGTPRLTKNAGLNRVIWDFAYPGPWDAGARRSGRGGPLAAPGAYTVRITANGTTETQPLTLRPDPRITKDGVTPAVLRAQLAHNLRVRDLVTEVNLAVAQLDAVKRSTKAAASSPDRARKLQAFEETLVTPSVRYSRPALQAHIQYLYSATAAADQKVGHDAEVRYAELRKELDAAQKSLRELMAMK